jgi:hypothetical protein
MSEYKSGLWVSPTYAECDVALDMIMDLVDESNIKSRRSERLLEFTNGASLRFLTPDPSRIKGRFVDFVVVDNADELDFDKRFDWLVTQPQARFLWIREVKVRI